MVSLWWNKASPLFWYFPFISPLHRKWIGGRLDSPDILSIHLSVHLSLCLSICRQGFQNIGSMHFISGIYHYGVSPIYCPIFGRKWGFWNSFSKTISSINLIPGIYPYGLCLLLSPINFHFPTVNFGPLVAKYLDENGVRKIYQKKKKTRNCRSMIY